MSHTLPLCSNCIVVILVRERTKAKMIPENCIKNLRDLTWRSGANQILRAVCDKRRCARACCPNHPSNIQRLVSNIESVTQHPNLRKLVAVWAMSLALRVEGNPLLPFRKLTQTGDRVLHRRDSGIEIAGRMLHERT